MGVCRQYFFICLFHQQHISVSLGYLLVTGPLYVIRSRLFYVMEGELLTRPHEQVPILVQLEPSIEATECGKNLPLKKQAHEGDIVFEEQEIIVEIPGKEQFSRQFGHGQQ